MKPEPRGMGDDNEKMRERTPIVETDGLSSQQLMALAAIAEQSHSPAFGASLNRVKECLSAAGLNNLGANVAIKTLERKGLIAIKDESDSCNADHFVVRVIDNGWDFLEANHDTLVLEEAPPPRDQRVTPPSSDDDVSF